jgi:starvation-inducible DNA-binding protein
VTVDNTHTSASILDQTLADLISLGMLAKQAHWNVEGPNFRSLHLLLDELADLARESGDEIAERAITLGHHPDGRAATVAAQNALPDLHAGPIRDQDVTVAFDAILDTSIRGMHQALDTTDNDPVTQDAITTIAGRLEKIAWMIRARR